MARKKILFLDDVRTPPDFYFGDADIWLCRNTEQAYKDLEKHRTIGFDEIWLDFDLGGVLGPDTEDYKTAMPIALYLAEEAFYGAPYPVKTIVIHTQNPVGQSAMKLLLEQYCYNVRIQDVEWK
jgi:hypothetical protein